MAYVVSGLTQAADYNGFANDSTPNVNSIWAVGSGNRGYGQTPLTTVNPGEIIKSQSWFDLVDNIQTSASHQGTSINPFRDGDPSAGELILFEPDMAFNITQIDSNRLNAVAQASTSATVATSATTWANSLTVTFTVAFANANNARYYFNAGGQIGLSFFHPNGSGSNATINDLCGDSGTVWLSSPTSGTATLSGISYNGVTKVGGSNPAGATINTNYGFHALTGVSTQIFRQDANSGYYYSGAYLRISASTNGSGTVTLVCYITDGGYYGGTVSAGTQVTLTLRPPSTTYLANSWGTPGISNTIVPA